MKHYNDKQIRNFCLVGHAGSGKTTLAEAMLFKAGVVNRLGSIKEGGTVSDFHTEEKERQSSIYATSMHCEWNNNLFHFIDTPGYADFQGDAISAMSTADATVYVLDAVSGIETGTLRSWKHTKSTARMFFIAGVDKEHSNYNQVISQLRESYGKDRVVPFTIPIGSGDNFSKVIHILKSNDVPEELADEINQYKTIVMDTVAEHDDELMMRYLEGEELTEEEISHGLHDAINDGSLIPVFCGSSTKDIGVEEVMNGVINLMPRPWNGRFPDHVDGSDFEYSTDGECVARVFKSVIDPFIGQLTYLRIYSGTMKVNHDYYNISKDSKERIGSILVMNGKNQTNVDEALPGSIVAIPKLKTTKNGDTIASNPKAAEIIHIVYPKPTLSHSVYSVKKGEEDKIAQALNRLSEEDPTIRLEQQLETHEFICHAMGDLQFTIIEGRLKSESRVEVDFKTPKTPYRETITATNSSVYRHKKQSGGSGQFAEVHLRLEPNAEQEFEFASEVVGGSIPKNFFPGIEKGIAEAMASGPIAKCKVINIKAIVFDGKHHPVDSNEMAFKIAGRMAFRDAMKSCKPMLLEPIMHMKILIPDQYMGDVNGDLSTRRGRIIGMGTEDGLQALEVEIPQAETYTYAQTLRSITQGRGSFEMDFDRYDRVPNNVAKEIMAANADEK